jgi:hypothetical protein
MPLTKEEVLAAPWKLHKPREEKGFFGHLADNLSGDLGGGVWRYGMTTADKAQAVMNGEVPGMPAIDENDPESAAKADRYAAGYYTQKTHPTMGGFMRGVGDLIHKPFGDWDIQKYAGQGEDYARAEQNEEENQKRLSSSKPGFFDALNFFRSND